MMNVRLPLWLLAPPIPVFLYVQDNHGANVLAAHLSAFNKALLPSKRAPRQAIWLRRTESLDIANGHI